MSTRSQIGRNPTSKNQPTPTPEEVFAEQQAIALYGQWIGPALGHAMASPGTPRQRAERAMKWVRGDTGWRRLPLGQALRNILRVRIVEASARQDQHQAIERRLPGPTKPLRDRLRDGEVSAEERERANQAGFWRDYANFCAGTKGGPVGSSGLIPARGDDKAKRTDGGL